MNNFFTIPDKEKNYQGYMLYMISIIWAVTYVSIICTGFYNFPNLWPRWATIICTVLFIYGFTITLNQLGYTRLASWSFIIMQWITTIAICYTGGGIRAPGILTQMSIILTAGFLLGWRGGLAIGLMTIGADFGLACLEVIGHLPIPKTPHSPITRWVFSIIPFVNILALQYYATKHLRAGLVAMKREIEKREEAEKIKDQTVYNLGERVKELKTLYAVSRILQQDGEPGDLFQQIIEVIPLGWQFPQTTAACICIGDKVYVTSKFRPSQYSQRAEMETNKGTKVSIEVVYLQSMPECDEGPFLHEERDLINMLAEILKTNLERRERRAELKDYKYALDIASGISITDVDNNFIFVNANFCKTNKYSANELLGQHWKIITSGVHSHKYFTEMQKALQEGEPFRGEFCNKAKDGTLYWVDTTIIPFLDESGKTYQHLSINYDITERKETEEKLKKSEELQRALIENMTNGLTLLNKNFMITYQSPSAERIIGYTLDERKTKKTSELIHRDDIVIIKESIKKVINNPKEPSNYQIRIFHKSGKILWLDCYMVNLLNNPNVGAIMINYTDVTERKAAEEKIKENEQLLRKITSQVPGNTYMFEIEETGHSKIIFCNRGTDTFNHSYDFVSLKKHPEILREVLHDDDKIKFNNTMKEAYQTQSIISFKYRIVTNGHVRWRWMQAVPEKDKNGKILWYGATSDITHLIDYIVSIEQMLFDIGHIIRRPLSSMIGMTKLIEETDLSAKKIKKISHNLYLISEEMDKFINELNQAYYQKSKDNKLNIDTSSLIDKRPSLFE